MNFDDDVVVTVINPSNSQDLGYCCLFQNKLLALQLFMWFGSVWKHPYNFLPETKHFPDGCNDCTHLHLKMWRIQRLGKSDTRKPGGGWNLSGRLGPNPPLLLTTKRTLKYFWNSTMYTATELKYSSSRNHKRKSSCRRFPVWTSYSWNLLENTQRWLLKGEIIAAFRFTNSWNLEFWSWW